MPVQVQRLRPAQPSAHREVRAHHGEVLLQCRDTRQGLKGGFAGANAAHKEPDAGAAAGDMIEVLVDGEEFILAIHPDIRDAGDRLTPGRNASMMSFRSRSSMKGVATGRSVVLGNAGSVVNSVISSFLYLFIETRSMTTVTSRDMAGAHGVALKSLQNRLDFGIVNVELEWSARCHRTVSGGELNLRNVRVRLQWLACQWSR